MDLRPRSRTTSRAVLIADDDAVQRRQISLYLGRLGVKTIEARDGAEAVRAMRALRPALVIMDILMPTLDGIQAVAAMEGTHDAKIILMTGDTDSLYRANVARLNVFATIEKPIPLRQLSRFVLQALDSLPR
jgi:CheY-like chemotaxis protein